MTTSFLNRVRPRGRALGAVALAVLLLAGSATAATLSGNVVYRGQGNGNIFVYIVRLNVSSPVVGMALLSAPGSWQVHGVPNGTYYAVAWQDLNGNLMPSRGEPVGYYGVPFPDRIIVSGANVGNLDIELGTFSIAAEIRGNIVYNGPQTGRIWIFPHLTPNLALNNVRGTPWTMTTPGEYQVFVFDDNTYYVTAYMDVNGNLLYDAGEPAGTAGPMQVVVTPSATYTADIVLSVNTTGVQERTWSQIKGLYQP